ncbi:MAG: glycosyltransferase family 2 protein [Bacteroidetes bacterium]|nr:glycosyltransferase family 2 protein [Bacteroidota bacterium]
MEKILLVSIIIPAFNPGRYLSETIKNLLGQSYKNLEIVVVDDGSSDGFVQKAQEEFSGTHGLRFIFQQNRGAASARNKGFLASSGSLIKFMDADDFLNEEAVQNQVTLAEKNPDAIISSQWGRFYQDDLSTFTLNPEPVWKDRKGIDWLIESLAAGPNMMQPGIFLIPRSHIEKEGLWNENLSLIDDFEYFSRLISRIPEIKFCDESTLYYRSGISGNLSGRKSRKAMESAFLSNRLGCEHLLAGKNNGQTRRICANLYAVWMYQFYPEHPDLVSHCEEAILSLGGSSWPYPGGKLTRILTLFLPWKQVADFKNLISKTKSRFKT